MSRDTSSRPHRVGAKALLPFAESEGGTLVNVESVPRGKKCGCICPECRGPLIAYKPRQSTKMAYFGHEPGAACDRPRALETMLHKLAKQLIEERKEVFLPAVFDESQDVLWPGGMFRPESVRLEVKVPGMRPDIIASSGQKLLFIEVAVWHKVGAEKFALISERRQSTIEIDLAKWRDETDKAVLEQAIIREAPRVWLFNRVASDREADRLARQEERAQQRRKHSTEIADAILRDLSRPLMGVAPKDSVFAKSVAAIEDVGMTNEVGVTIPGSGAFGVAAEIWQAVVLHLLLRQWKGTVQHIPLDNHDCLLLSAAATEAYRNEAVDWVVVEQITEGKVRDPRAVIRDYLNRLCERDIATRYVDDRYAASHAARQRAEAAWEEKQARLKRHTDLGKTFREVSCLVGAPTMAFEAWMDIRHQGIEATPRELADLRKRGFSDLLERMKRIGNLVTSDAAIVEGGLLGFPAEEQLAALKADAERQRLEAKERDAARMAKEAADRLQKIRATTQDIEGGEAFLHEPLKVLGGRSIEQTEGRMLPTEERHVWSLIRGRQANALKKREQQAAADEKAEAWRAKLIQDVVDWHGEEFGQRVLGAIFPQTFKRSLRDYCTDERTYNICVKLARGVKRRPYSK